MKDIINQARLLGASRAYTISPAQVPLTWKASLLCLDCKVSKIKWMGRWSCPPYSPTPDQTKELAKKFSYALVINLEAEIPPLVNKSWDSRNLFLQLSQKIYVHTYWKRLHKIMLGLKSYFKKKSISSYCWGSAPCHGCFKCSYPAKCRRPESFLMAPEASGIELYRLAQIVGIPIQIPPRSKIELMSLAFFRL